MAERTVAVRLIARVDAYTAAMAKASAATAAMAGTSQAQLTRVGTTMQTVGKRMSTWMTVPLLGIGAVATKMAMDFDTAFGQISALTNVSAGEIDGLKESVMELSGTTAKSPQELAEALYFATSAGLDTAAAMDVVTMSAQASAAGMGSTQDVTQVLAAALNVYGEANLSAADAADILTAAIEEGSAEPAEYAQSLGRVIPIAAQMGIGFDEVAGSMAFLTNQGLDADEAVTALRGTMLALMDPTAQGRDTLREMGTSFEEVQAAIAEDGLLGALVLLREHGFVGNSEAMSNLFEDNRALVGATSLLADTSGTLGPILDATRDSAGSLGEAFATTADTDAFKMRQAMADVQAAMVTLGAILLPIAADIATAIADVATWFANLPGPVQGFMIAIGGVAAVLGPLLVMLGTVVKSFGILKIAMSGMAGPAAGVAAALTLGFLAYQQLTEGSREQEEATKASTAALNTQFPALISAAVAAAKAGEEVDSLAIANEALSMALSEGEGDVLRIMSELNVGADQMLEVITGMQAGGAEMHQTWVMLAESFGLTHEQAGKVSNLFASGMSLADMADNSATLAADIGVTEEQFGHLVTRLWELDGAVESANVEDITRQFLDGRVAASGYADSMVEAAEALAGTTRLEDPIAVFRAFTTVALQASDAERTVAGVTDQVNAEMAVLAPGVAAVGEEFGTLEEVMMTGADAMGVLSETFENLKRNMVSGPGNMTGMDWEKLDLFGAALEEVTSIQSDYVRSGDKLWENTDKFGESIDETTTSLEANTEGGRINRAVLADWSADILAHAQAGLAQGKSLADVTGEFKHNRQAMIDAAVAAGMEEDAVIALLDKLGMADDDWEAAIKVSGDQLAMKKIEMMLLELDEFDAEFIAELNAYLETNGPMATLGWLRDQIDNRVTMPIDANISAALNAISRLRAAASIAGVLTRFRAEGGYVDRPELSVIGEAGPEVVLPLTDRSRMTSLLGMPQVLGPIMSALGAGARIAAPSGGGGGGGNVTYITATVNMAPGTDGDDVVRALRQWERRRGPLPVSTRR